MHPTDSNAAETEPASTTAPSTESLEKSDTRRLPIAGDVWIGVTVDDEGARHRRVIQVFQGCVFYSVGGDQNRHCKLETFQRWMRHAELRSSVESYSL